MSKINKKLQGNGGGEIDPKKFWADLPLPPEAFMKALGFDYDPEPKDAPESKQFISKKDAANNEKLNKLLSQMLEINYGIAKDNEEFLKTPIKLKLTNEELKQVEKEIKLAKLAEGPSQMPTAAQMVEWFNMPLTTPVSPTPNPDPKAPSVKLISKWHIPQDYKFIVQMDFHTRGHGADAMPCPKCSAQVHGQLLYAFKLYGELYINFCYNCHTIWSEIFDAKISMAGGTFEEVEALWQAEIKKYLQHFGFSPECGESKESKGDEIAEF